ncbi:MAG: hypothetical protein EOO77_29185 [Oxalobacteraceae bacterium]|nr:MAG: hypothetical protein EOO77_29185 [Oxalobacteraceae bacterium]
MAVVPEFTLQQIALIRRMSREQKTADEVRIALGLPLGTAAIRRRAKAIGVHLSSKKAHEGMTKLYHPDGNKPNALG